MKEIIAVPKGNLNINGALCLIREKLRKKFSKEFKFLLLSAIIFVILFNFTLNCQRSRYIELTPLRAVHIIMNKISKSAVSLNYNSDIYFQEYLKYTLMSFILELKI